jgi:protein SCO1
VSLLIALLAQAVVPARDLGFEQRLDAALPMDTRFRDECGAPLSLGAAAEGRPFILAFVYFRCPSLCVLVVEGLKRSLRSVAFDAGRDYTVVLVSIDPREGPELAAARRDDCLRAYGRGDAGWRALTGDEASIAALTRAAGFRFAYDAASDQYAHPGGILLATPQGRISKVFPGVVYDPRDLRLGLVEAAAGRIGTAVDALLLFCYAYDPASGRYGLSILRTLRIAGVLTVLILGGAVWRLSRRRPA